MKTGFFDRLEGWGWLLVALLLICAALALLGCSAPPEPQPLPPEPPTLGNFLWGLLTPETPTHLQNAQASAYRFDQWISTAAIFLGIVATASGKVPNWVGFSLGLAGIGLKIAATVAHVYGGLIAVIVIAALVLAFAFYACRGGVGKLFTSIKDFIDGRISTKPNPINHETKPQT